MSDDPVDVHRALQKAARELAFYADHGHWTEYYESIDRLEVRLQAVRKMTQSNVTERGGRYFMQIGQNMVEIDPEPRVGQGGGQVKCGECGRWDGHNAGCQGQFK